MRLAAAPTRPTCAFSVEPTTATGTGRVSLPSEITHTTLKTRSTAPRKSFHSNKCREDADGDQRRPAQRHDRNLLMAGLCMSADQLALSSARVTTTCSMMDQAAGIGAAMATPCATDAADLHPLEVGRWSAAAPLDRRRNPRRRADGRTRRARLGSTEDWEYTISDSGIPRISTCSSTLYRASRSSSAWQASVDLPTT